MAFTRKFLKALGIEDDKIEEIMTSHIEVVNALKQERDGLQEKVDSLDDVQKQLNDANKKLKAYEDSGDDSWEQKYNAEKEAKEKAENDLKDYKATVEAEKTLENKKSIYKNFLKEAGISEKRLDTILKVTDMSKIELDEDGKIKNAENVKKSVQEEWKDFIVTQGEQGARTATPPENNGGTGSSGQSRAAQLAAKYHEGLYGAVNKKED